MVRAFVVQFYITYEYMYVYFGQKCVVSLLLSLDGECEGQRGYTAVEIGWVASVFFWKKV